MLGPGTYRTKTICPGSSNAWVFGADCSSWGRESSPAPTYPSASRLQREDPRSCATHMPLEHALINGVFLSVLRGPIMSL